MVDKAAITNRLENIFETETLVVSGLSIQKYCIYLGLHHDVLSGPWLCRSENINAFLACVACCWIYHLPLFGSIIHGPVKLKYNSQKAFSGRFSPFNRWPFCSRFGNFMLLNFRFFFLESACIAVMFIVTFVMPFVVFFVWQRNMAIAAAFLLFFCFIEGVYISAVLIKVPQRGWVPLLLLFIFVVVMFVCHYGTQQKYKFQVHNKVSLKWLLGLGPRLGIVRVPGIILICSELATGVPPIFSASSRVRFQLPPNPALNPMVREELMNLIQVKEVRVAYIMEYSYVKAKISA